VALVPTSLLVLQRLQAHLRLMAPGQQEYRDRDDAVYDLSSSVYLHRVLFGADTAAPFLSLLPAPKQEPYDAADMERLTSRSDWLLLLQGYERNDGDEIEAAYYLMAAAQAHLSRIVEQRKSGSGPKYPDEHLLGLNGVVTALDIGQGIVRPPDGQQVARTFFYIPLVVSYVVDMTTPYSTA
jgi:hypothetical protein